MEAVDGKEEKLKTISNNIVRGDRQVVGDLESMGLMKTPRLCVILAVHRHGSLKFLEDFNPEGKK